MDQRPLRIGQATPLQQHDLTLEFMNGRIQRRNPTMLKSYWLFVLIVFIALASLQEKAEARAIHNSRDIQDSWADAKSLDLLRYLWEVKKFQEHNDRMAIVGHQEPQQPINYKRANTNCLFHAGLAHNCDYRDIIASVNEMSYWGSDLAPGKRRKK